VKTGLSFLNKTNITSDKLAAIPPEADQPQAEASGSAVFPPSAFASVTAHLRVNVSFGDGQNPSPSAK
jgi:hypothetical protein